MRELVPTAAARRAAEALADDDRDTFNEIWERLVDDLALLRRVGYVKPYSFRTLHCLRYFDNNSQTDRF